MDQWKKFLNKNLKLIYEDGENHLSQKIGYCSEINDTHLILEFNGQTQAILLSKITRIEVLQ